MAAVLCAPPDGRLALDSAWETTIRLWDVGKGTEIARLELDAPIQAIVAPLPNLMIAGNPSGLHWLEVRS